MNAELRAMHDLLVANQPPGVEHSCGLCSADQEDQVDFTKEQQAEIDRLVQAAVASATAPLNDQIAALSAAKANEDQAAAITAAVDEAVTPVRAELETVRSDLDAAVARAVAAETQLADLTSFLESEQARAEEEAAAAARKDERVAEVAKVIAFDEEHVAKNAQRWAEMSPEAFTATLEDYAALAASTKTAPKPGATTVPSKRPAFTAAADTAPAGKASAAKAVMRDIRRDHIRQVV